MIDRDHDVWSLAYKTVLEFKSNCVFLWEAHAVTTLPLECGSEPRRAPLTKSIMSACGYSQCVGWTEMCVAQDRLVHMCVLLVWRKGNMHVTVPKFLERNEYFYSARMHSIDEKWQQEYSYATNDV